MKVNEALKIMFIIIYNSVPSTSCLIMVNNGEREPKTTIKFISFGDRTPKKNLACVILGFVYCSSCLII